VALRFATQISPLRNYNSFSVLVGNSNNISLLEKLASKGKGVPAISQSKFDALYAAGNLPDVRRLLCPDATCVNWCIYAGVFTH
jgi:hydroxyethylthiazole kinase-like sugar kinase family protein